MGIIDVFLCISGTTFGLDKGTSSALPNNC